MAADAIRIERPTTNSRLFLHTRWDAVSSWCRAFPSRVPFRAVLSVSVCAVLGDADSRVSLLADGEREHRFGVAPKQAFCRARFGNA